MVSEEKSFSVDLTNKQVNMVLAIIYIFVGASIGYPVANRINSDVRADSFTGTQGAIHDDRIDLLEMEHSLFGKSIEDCKEHREKLESTVESLVISAATMKQKQIANEYLIKRCMQATGQ